MKPHPDFADTVLPREDTLGAFELTPLTADYVDEDYAAVSSSIAAMDEAFGTPHDGLTFEENRIDLAWHDREFTLGRSFSWIIRDAAGHYLGCFYLFPDPGARGTAEGVIWIRTTEQRDGIAHVVIPLIQKWSSAHLPEHVTVRWKLSPDITSGT